MRRAGRYATLLHILCAVAATASCTGRDLTSPVPERRARAVSALSRSSSARDLQALILARQDADPMVRRAVAGALSARGGAVAIDALGSLAADPDPDVAVAAARELGRHAQERRTAALIVEAWWQAPAGARPELAAALAAVGGSPREAVQLEARRLWERYTAALQLGPGRAAAAEELGRSGRAEAVKLLLPLLQSTDGALVAAAARGLGLAADRAARPRLERLLDAPDAPIVEAAAGALASLGDPAASSALARLALSGPDRLALAAVEALGDLPQAPEVGVALCETLLRAPSAPVAAAAARRLRLREVDCPERPLLARLGRRGGDVLPALAAAGGLRLEPDRQRALGEAITVIVSAANREPAVRSAAATALAQMGHAAAAPVLAGRAIELSARLAQARGQAPAPAGARAAAGEAGQTDPAGAPAGLEEELGAVVVALSRLGGEAANDQVRLLAADRSPALRRAGAEALGTRGDWSLAALELLLRDPVPEVRLAAVRALGRPGAARAALLARALEGERGDAAWQVELARALAETGVPEAAPALGRLLDGPAAAVAAGGLARLGSRDSSGMVEARLSAPVSAGRVELIEALGQLGGPKAGPAVARELLSDRPEVRAAAVRVVGRLRYDPAAPWLEALRADYSGDVRRAAIEALAKLPVREPGRR